MFGLIKPFTPELKVKENELYKATYCGLCRCMGKSTSRLSRLTLSYDSVFLALIRICMFEEQLEIKKVRCPVNIFKKRNAVEVTEQLEYTAAVSSYLIYYKALDDVMDSYGFKKLKARLFLPFAKRMYKKAPRIESIESKVAEYIRKTRELEVANCPSLYPLADLFGALMGDICAYGTDDPVKKAAAYEVGLHTGRFIYIADAIKDHTDDVKNKEYNPFICGGVDPQNEKDALFNALCIESEGAYAGVLLLSRGISGGICENITQLGFVHTAKEIFKTKQTRKEK